MAIYLLTSHGQSVGIWNPDKERAGSVLAAYVCCLWKHPDNWAKGEMKGDTGTCIRLYEIDDNNNNNDNKIELYFFIVISVT